MPTISSHANRNVSKIWFVGLFAFAAMTSVTWKIMEGIEAIMLDAEASQERVNELLEDRYCPPRSADC